MIFIAKDNENMVQKIIEASGLAWFFSYLKNYEYTIQEITLGICVFIIVCVILGIKTGRYIKKHKNKWF